MGDEFKGQLRRGGVPVRHLATIVVGALLVASSALTAVPVLSSRAGAESPPLVPVQGRQGSVPPGATLVGPTPTGTKLSLVVTLEPRDPAALAAAVHAASDPASPEYRHFLTPAQFAARYGATPVTIDRVGNALRNDGLAVGRPSATGLSLPVSGTVGQVQTALSTQISNYRLASGRMGYRADSPPRLPANVASSVEGILGLDTLNPPQPADQLALPGPPHSLTRSENGASSRSPDGSPTLAPGQPHPVGEACTSGISGEETDGAYDAVELADAYSFDPLYGQDYYGAGSTIALVELYGAGYSPSDITTFANCYDITLGNGQISAPDGAGTIGAGTVESELDIETALSLAPKANIEVYEGGPTDSIYNVLSQIVDDDTAKIVSVSWTNGCEAYTGTSVQVPEATLLEASSMEGQSVFVASGDQGSEGCNVNRKQGAPTGSGPVAQAVDPSTGTLYIANQLSNSVSVDSEGSPGDPGGSVVKGSVPTAASPSAVALDTTDKKVFVADKSANELTVFPASSCNATTTSGCGTTTISDSGNQLEGPRALAVYGTTNGTTLYVANSSGSVALYNAATNQFVTSVSLPPGTTPSAIAVDQENGVVYLTDSSNARIEYFRASTCNVTTTSGCGATPATVAVGDNPDSLAVDDTAGNLDVGNAGQGGGVTVVSLSDQSVETTISTDNPYGVGLVQSVALSPSGHQVLAVLSGTWPGDILATIDPQLESITGSVYLESGSDTVDSLVADPFRNYAWIIDSSAGVGMDIVQDLNLAVTDPASQPGVTSVGGTSISSLGSPPTEPPTERTWNDQGIADGAGGGGMSSTFAMPGYQQASLGTSGSGQGPCPGGVCREVPDVSADADPATGYIVYLPTNGQPAGWTSYGGTSAAAPLWAAVLAVVSSADGTWSGEGLLNDALYALGSSGNTYFNDVTTGNNDYNATSSGQYPASPGYDMATGLGTPIASALATGLNQIPLDVAVSGTQPYLGSPTFSGKADYGGTGAAPLGVMVNTSDLKCSTVNGSTPITANLAFGSYTLMSTSCGGATLSGVNAAHYVIVYTSANDDFVVTIVVTVGGQQTYGGAPSFTGGVNESDLPPGITVNTAGLTCRDVGTSTLIAPTLPAGVDTVAGSSCSGATLSGSGSSDYAVSYSGAPNGFTVDPAPLTVTASSPTTPFGVVPPVTPSGQGFVNGQGPGVLSGSCTSGTLKSSPPGNYTSSCTGVSDPNYAITFVPGTTTVTIAPLVVTVSGSQTWKGSPAFSASSSQPLIGATLGTGAVSCTTVDGSMPITPTLAVGVYTLVAASCSGATLSGQYAGYYRMSYTAPSADFTVRGGPHGYWLVGSDGGIFTFGSAGFYGSTGSLKLQRPVVGITPTADKAGYWLDASDGGVFSFGDAGFYGSIPGLGLHPAGSGLPNSLNAPVVGMVPTTDGRGYFMVASDGGVFAFGDARFEGSCPGIGGCSGAAVAVVPDATGNGYWIVTQTGNVYTFGDARYFGGPGSDGAQVMSAVRTWDGGGYWILRADGTVDAFGDAVGHAGPTGYVGGFNPATAIFTDSDSGGYWVADAEGAVFSYGDAPFDGSMSGKHLNGPIIAATGF